MNETHLPIFQAFLLEYKKFIKQEKGRSHMRPRMDFHLVLNGEYLWPINYKNAFIYFNNAF